MSQINSIAIITAIVMTSTVYIKKKSIKRVPVLKDKMENKGDNDRYLMAVGGLHSKSKMNIETDNSYT